MDNAKLVASIITILLALSIILWSLLHIRRTKKTYIPISVLVIGLVILGGGLYLLKVSMHKKEGYGGCGGCGPGCGQPCNTTQIYSQCSKKSPNKREVDYENPNLIVQYGNYTLYNNGFGTPFYSDTEKTGVMFDMNNETSAGLYECNRTVNTGGNTLRSKTGTQICN